MRVLTAGLLGMLLGGAPAPAGAIPSGGASPDTAGTSVTVSPKTLTAGATISFRVSGFPAGEVVYVKIDDGNFCSQSGVHGACVVHQQRIPASGPVVGSLVLPADLTVGKHWLRFLASKEMRDADGTYVGVKGYTLRGASDFTVVAASPSAGSTTSAGRPAADSSSPSTTASTGAVVPEDTATAAGAAPPGATLGATPGPTSAVPSASADAGGTPAPAATAAVIRQEPVDQPFPLVGIVGFAVLCALAGWLVLRSRRG